MSTTTLQYEIHDSVATITLNRPQVFNSFNREMALALQKQLDDCVADDNVRAIILTGNGKAFCAGQDLQEVTDPDLNPGFKAILEEHYNPIIMQIRRMRKIVIAAVNGVAAGAGANIALACDLVVAREDVKFIQAFSKIGLIPDSAGTYFLPRLVGQARATAMMLLGEPINAIQAEHIGMIYKAVPEADFQATVTALAHKIAQMPTHALGLTKSAIHASTTNSLTEQLALESEYQIEAASTDDYREGVAAFLEKRKPVFTGR